MKRLLIGLFVLFAPVLALAQETPPAPGPDVDPGAMINTLVDAIGSSNWGLLAAAVVMILVWVIRKFLWKAVNAKVLPWLAVSIGALSGAGAALIEDNSDWIRALLNGISLGLMAAGQWGLLGAVMKKKDN